MVLLVVLKTFVYLLHFKKFLDVFPKETIAMLDNFKSLK